MDRIEDRGNGQKATFYANGYYVVTSSFRPQDYPGDDRYPEQTVVIESGWWTYPTEAEVHC